MEELVLRHLPPKVERAPPCSTEFGRVAVLANLMGRQKNWTISEAKVKVEKARAKVVEEEERVAGMEKELDGVQKQIAAHEGG